MTNISEKISAKEIITKLELLIATGDFSEEVRICEDGGSGSTSIEFNDYALEFDYEGAVVWSSDVQDIMVELTEVVDDECSDQTHIIKDEKSKQIIEFLIECYITQQSWEYVTIELNKIK